MGAGGSTRDLLLFSLSLVPASVATSALIGLPFLTRHTLTLAARELNAKFCRPYNLSKIYLAGMQKELFLEITPKCSSKLQSALE